MISYEITEIEARLRCIVHFPTKFHRLAESDVQSPTYLWFDKMQ